MQLRFIRLTKASGYLGMDKNRFNAEVRLYLTEIPIGVARQVIEERKRITTAASTISVKGTDKLFVKPVRTP